MLSALNLYIWFMFVCYCCAFMAVDDWYYASFSVYSFISCSVFAKSAFLMLNRAVIVPIFYSMLFSYIFKSIAFYEYSRNFDSYIAISYFYFCLELPGALSELPGLAFGNFVFLADIYYDNFFFFSTASLMILSTAAISSSSFAI